MYKRAISIILTLMIAISTITAPVSAISIGEDSAKRRVLTREEIKTIIISAFPEYQDKIEGKNLNTTEFQMLLASNEVPSLVYQETREINESDTVTYQEYSDGTVWATTSLTGNRTVLSTGDLNGFTYVTMNIYTYCTYAQNTILVENVGLIYKSGEYGEFQSAGTPASQSGFAFATRSLYTITGTDNSPAYLKYTATLDLNESWGPLGVLQRDAYLLVTLKSSGYSVSAGWVV